MLTPAEADPLGESFTFDQGLKRESGEDGFADVWRKDCFAWEYKGRHKDLASAYSQLQLYRDALGNPPLLVVCDFDRFEIHTVFNNSVTRVYRFTNSDIATDTIVPESRFTALEILRALFEDPSRLNPGKSPEKLTEEAANLLGELTEDMRKHRKLTGVSDHDIARFIMRMIFCFFASDVGLLPKQSFTDVIRLNKSKPESFRHYLGELFTAMKDGGEFLMRRVPHFNGGLFDNSYVPELIADHIASLERLGALDWSDIEPSIFGTLFERILDPNTRTQLGAHYTSKEDIQTVVEPVLLAPLLRDWDHTESQAQTYLAWREQTSPERERQQKELEALVSGFLQRLCRVRVLDPACGSGNFLYISLSLLKALEKKVLAFAAIHGIQGMTPRVHPSQLFGIELNEYAHQLASAVVWIGYLQWKYRNAIDLENEDPILQALENIYLMDAILDLTDPDNPKEPVWPDADVIVGNPPFLGGKLLRTKLGDAYVDALFHVYTGQVSAEADLVCYWHEKARAMVETGKVKRVGLLATQGIRGGANRRVLERTKETGDIFLAYSDREWVLEGAAVHVSIVGFDDGSETHRTLDGKPVSSINANLTAGTDLTKARRLKENLGIAFMGDTKVGPFDIPESLARTMLSKPNPHGKSNSNVVRPWVNAFDLTRRPRKMWIVDFPPGMSLQDAALYEAPFEYIKQHVKPMRAIAKSGDCTGVDWWIHQRPRPEMREVIAKLKLRRFICTPRVSKHRLFVWLPSTTLPDCATIAIARDDDYTFGVLHSRVHELWSRGMGTQLREVESGFRYTPTTTFETFPFPEPTLDQRETIAEAAKHLNELRERWMNPPEGSIGPSELKKRTLTNLYNERPTWLEMAHNRLDEAMSLAYRWDPDLPADEILSRLMSLNLQREPTKTIPESKEDD
jgi:type II restriction/modification system DNA methylase subunit YeeA